MIISFSGTDGVGKSTQLFKFAEYLRGRIADYGILYARGMNTKIGGRLLKTGRLLRETGHHPVLSNAVSAFGMHISIWELMVIWGISLRLKCHRHSVMLCDRYDFDTYVDWIDNFGPIATFWWRLLEWIIPKPNITLLFSAPVEIVAQRLNHKEPDRHIECREIQKALSAYEAVENHFDHVIRADRPEDDVFCDVLDFCGWLIQNILGLSFHPGALAVRGMSDKRR